MKHKNFLSAKSLKVCLSTALLLGSVLISDIAKAQAWGEIQAQADDVKDAFIMNLRATKSQVYSGLSGVSVNEVGLLNYHPRQRFSTFRISVSGSNRLGVLLNCTDTLLYSYSENQIYYPENTKLYCQPVKQQAVQADERWVQDEVNNEDGKDAAIATVRDKLAGSGRLLNISVASRTSQSISYSVVYTHDGYRYKGLAVYNLKSGGVFFNPLSPYRVAY